MFLDERKIKILSAIIDDYIATAEPIGSRTIARKYRIGISPATIRNEMADLEELGYLSQPHTSAGRVPSDKGYRFYVDFLMPTIRLKAPEQELLRKLFRKRIKEIGDLVEEAALIISMLTSYTAITLGPQLESSQLKHVQLSRIEEGIALILVVTNYGTIHHHILKIPNHLTDGDLIRITNALNQYLIGKTVSEITGDTIDAIKAEMIEYDEILNVLADILRDNLNDAKEDAKVISTGSSKMLEHPEFKDLEKARNFLGLLEQHELIVRALNNAAKPNTVTVTIGNENPCVELQDFSIVTASFAVEGKNLGTFGILGPTRMEYSKVVSILEKVTDYLDKTILNLI